MKLSEIKWINAKYTKDFEKFCYKLIGLISAVLWTAN